MSFLKNLEKGAKKAGNKASKGAKKAGKNIGKSVGKGAKSAVKAVKKGAKGANIKEAQKALKKKLKVDVKIDGQFGPKMEDLIKQAQKKAKIKPTGMMDAATQVWLGVGKTAKAVEDAVENVGDRFAALAGKTKFLKPLQAQYNQSKKMKAELEKRLAKVAMLLAKAADDAQVAQIVVAVIHAEIKVITTILETMIRTQQEGVKLLAKVDKMVG